MDKKKTPDLAQLLRSTEKEARSVTTEKIDAVEKWRRDLGLAPKAKAHTPAANKAKDTSTKKATTEDADLTTPAAATDNQDDETIIEDAEPIEEGEGSTEVAQANEATPAAKHPEKNENTARFQRIMRRAVLAALLAGGIGAGLVHQKGLENAKYWFQKMDEGAQLEEVEISMEEVKEMMAEYKKGDWKQATLKDYKEGNLKKYRYFEILHKLSKPFEESVAGWEGKYEIGGDKLNEAYAVKIDGGKKTHAGFLTASEMAKKDGLPDPLFAKYLIAEAQAESKYKYHALGPEIAPKGITNFGNAKEHWGTKALGVYQIMPLIWIDWCLEHEGKVLKPTPAAMEYIAYKQFLKHYKELQPEYKKGWALYWALSSKWNSGKGKQGEFKIMPMLNDLGISVPELGPDETNKYADGITKNMGLSPSKAEYGVQCGQHPIRCAKRYMD